MVIDEKLIKSLRKDFLLLMKNTKRLKSYDQALEWRHYVRKWVSYFEETLLNKLPKKVRRDKGDSEGTRLVRDLRKISFPFLSNLRNLPLELQDDIRGLSKEVLFDRFKKELPKWESKVRRLARATWKETSSVLQSLGPLDVGKDYKTKIEGFTVVVKDYSLSPADPQQYLELFRESLKRYRRRATKVLPLLIKSPLPFVYDFGEDVLSDTGAEYKKTFIHVNAYVEHENPKRIVHVLAHEMGHHIWNTYLSGQDKKFWSNMIKGNYGILDFREVLKNYGSEQSFLWNPKMKKRDPIMYLQVEGLLHDPRTEDIYSSIITMEDLRDFIARTGITKEKVHGKPITGYASKNSQEAFCEAIGMLVGYGPRTVLSEVQQWLRVILPQIKIGKLSNVRKDLIKRAISEGMKRGGDLRTVR